MSLCNVSALNCFLYTCVAVDLDPRGFGNMQCLNDMNKKCVVCSEYIMSLVPHASCIQFIIVCANGVVQETHHTAEKCKSTVHADRDCHSSSLYISLLPFLAVLCRLIPHFCIDLHLCIGERFP